MLRLRRPYAMMRVIRLRQRHGAGACVARGGVCLEATTCLEQDRDCFYQAHTSKFMAECYQAFIRKVLARTTHHLFLIPLRI